MSKQEQKIRNWSDYNKALVNRGSITLWFDEDSIKNWYNNSNSKSQGRPKLYSDTAVLCSLSIKAVFHLPLRATEGLISSLIQLMGLSIQPPNYSTLSRRQKALEIDLAKIPIKGPINIVVDSTGLKVYGEGEWKVRQHGYSKRRTWRKLHLAVNPKNHIIEASVATTNDYKDNQVIEDLLEQVTNDILQVCADGAYDSENCYQALSERDIKATIPPRKGAKIRQHGNSHSEPHQRDENLRNIRKIGKKSWKKESGYHQRSLSETAMFRIKTIFGAKLMSRDFANQGIEALIWCRALNIMTTLGMPARSA